MDGIKTTARVIVTYECNRHCPGCCNGHGNAVRKIRDIRELLGYKEIVITCGEPMLLHNKLLMFIIELRDLMYTGNIYIYTATWEGFPSDKSVLEWSNGITYTLHAEATDNDVISCKELSAEIENISDKNARRNSLDRKIYSWRLIIDNRLYDRYDFSNIDLTPWDVIRKLQWKDYCEPAPNEELVEFLL